MKNALILHGAGNDSKGNWFPWLKKELEGKGFKVWVPNFPDSEIPNLDNWLKLVFENKNWEFNSETVLIGHSAGATLILRILEKLPEGIKINKAILVAGFATLGKHPQYFKYKESILEKPFNWKKISSSCSNFYFIHSDNDRYDCGVEQGKIFQSNLGGRLEVFKNQDHFNLEVSDSYRSFPKLLEYI